MITEAQLANLLKTYQQCSPKSKEAKTNKREIINNLSVSYWWRSQLILDLFPEKVKRIEKQLKEELEEELEFHLKHFSKNSQMANSLLKKAITLKQKYQKELITDEFINTLAREVKYNQDNHSKFQRFKKVLYQAMEIKNSYKKIGLAGNLKLSERDYHDAFVDAKHKSFCYILDRIHQYDETKNFMALINYWMPFKFQDAALKILGLKKESKIIIQPEDFDSEPMKKRVGEQAKKAEEEFSYNQRSAELKEIIKEHPEFQKPVRKNRPDITFADVLIAKQWEDKRDTDLSREWNIPYTTIRSFYKKEFERLKPYLAEILQ